MTAASPLRVVQLLGRSTGGIGTHVADLAGRLRGLGVRVMVATDAITAEQFGWPEAEIVWPDPRSGPATAAGRLLRLRRLLLGADVVHAHGFQAGLLAGTLLRPRPRCPRLAISLHNQPPDLAGPVRVAGALARSRSLARADLVTGASSDLVALAVGAGARRSELAEVPSPRVPALLRASEADRAEARAGIGTDLGLDRDATLVVTISRLAPQKDLPTLVRAAAQLEQPVTWAVAGGGDEAIRSQVLTLAGETGAPVRLLGPVTDPARLLLAADVVALPSRWEARALVVQEAMAGGIPVVATDVGGLPDLLAGIGTLVPAGDPEALAAAVAATLADPTEAARRGRLGRERAARWADGEAMARRWLTRYRELLLVTYS